MRACPDISAAAERPPRPCRLYQRCRPPQLQWGPLRRWGATRPDCPTRYLLYRPKYSIITLTSTTDTILDTSITVTTEVLRLPPNLDRDPSKITLADLLTLQIMPVTILTWVKKLTCNIVLGKFFFPHLHRLDHIPQCENFRIFLSLRFYVKSILENLEILKLPFFIL